MKKMKIKLITLIAIILLATPVSARPMTVKVNRCRTGYRATVYWRHKKIAAYRFKRKPKVRFVKSAKLTEKMLTSRKGKTLYIEIIDGKQIDRRGNGLTTGGYYIRYHGFCKGDRIRSYCVYNPNTNYIDDVAERYDAVR